MGRKLCFLTFFVFVAGLAVSSPAAVEVMYYDDFDGSAIIDLNGTTPDTTTGGAKWRAGAGINADGSIVIEVADVNDYGSSAYLPFTPISGYVYELSATLVAQQTPGQDPNNWLAMGFTQNQEPNDRFLEQGVYWWGLTRNAECVDPCLWDQSFVGVRTNGSENATTRSADTIKIVLDTIDSQWVADFYFNGGLERTTNITNPGGINYASFTNSNSNGTIDDFTLTRELGPKAGNPSPAHGDTTVLQEADLSWLPGVYADTHDIYLGTDYNDVNDATRGVPLGVLEKQDHDTNSYDPGTLVDGITYYWRVDEVNLSEVPAIWKGNVWQFKTKPLIYSGTLYYDNFDGPCDVLLDGTIPDISVSNAAWQAGTSVDANGDFFAWGSTGTMFTAALPITPITGAVYELSADINHIGDWMGIGFLNTISNLDTRILDNGVQLWELIRGNQDISHDQAFIGPGTGGGGGLGDSNTKSAGTMKVRVELNSETNWRVTWYFDGSPEFQRTIDPTAITPNLVLNYVAFGSNGYYSSASGTITRFEFEEIPQALLPNPTDGSLVYGTDVTLSWQAGIYAGDHDVYFSDNQASVISADSNDPMGPGEVYKARQGPNSFSLTDLTPGATYYWRIDEVNLPNIWRGEIWSFMIEPLIAYEPSPSNGAKYIKIDEDLSWSPGSKAVTHDIYLGTDETAVTNANRTTTLGVLEKQDHNSTSYDPGTLQNGKIYYWRIDEVNASDIWKGDVWNFETRPFIPITDPNLIGYWKFDEGTGPEAIDWSGHNKDGTLVNGPKWVSGQVAGALQFDGIDDYVDLPIGPNIAEMNDITVAAWVNFASKGDNAQRVFDFGTGTTEYIYLAACSGAPGSAMVFGITTGAGVSQLTGPTLPGNEWHHVAVMISGTSNAMQFYYDGGLVASGVPTLLPKNLGVTTNNWLGQSQTEGVYFTGFLDEVRLYKKALTEDELRTLISPAWAWVPEPADNATDVKVIPKPLLSWLPGNKVDKHDVYFGTDFNDVNDATRAAGLGVLVSENQDACSYDPCEINFDTTYYWRVDEVNLADDPNIWLGDVWTFTTANYIEIDNFNRYLTRDEVRAVWEDGYDTFENGSNITLSTTIDSRYPAGHAAPGPIHQGSNALQFVYDNSKIDIWIYVPGYDGYKYNVFYYFSEMKATVDDLECVSDWTSEDVKLLSLQFSGDPDNDIGPNEQMYIALEDGEGDIALVKYGDSAGEDTNNLKSRDWTEWAIDLQEFEDANASFNIEDVNKVYIGFGERYNNTTAGGSGVVYFDSIRLDWAKCVPAMAPASDLSDDCTTDLYDFILLADSWGAEPSTAVPIIDLNASNFSLGPPASWPNTDGTLGGQFDVNSADINDNPTSGIVDGLPVVTFDGSDYLIADFNAPGGITGANDFTVISTVFNPAIDVEEMIITWARRGGPAYTTGAAGYGTDPAWGAVIHWNEGGEEPDMGFDGGVPAADMWHQIGITYNGVTEKVVVDGKLNAVEGSKILNIYADDPVVVGAGYDWDFNDVNDPNDPPDFINMTLLLSASVNRIQVYDEALSQAQLEYIATGSYSADLNGDGKVNFKDLAMMLDDWLKEVLFP